MTDDVRIPQPGRPLAHPRPPARVIGLVGLLATAALVLLYEHRAHVLGLFPWVLILLCPLLHAFGHGGHGGHGARGAGHRHAAPDAEPAPQDAAEVRVEPRRVP